MALAKNFIKAATKNKGGLHKSLGVPLDQPIPEDKIRAATKRPGKVGQQARLAETLKGLRPKKNKKSSS